MKTLSRPSRIISLLFIVGVISFVIVWGIAGQTGMQIVPRLMLSLCLPPGVISLLTGVYILTTRPKV